MLTRSNPYVKLLAMNSEHTFATELKKRLEVIQSHEQSIILGSVLEREEYLQHVGYLRALKDVLEDFNEVHSVFFPT